MEILSKTHYCLVKLVLMIIAYVKCVPTSNVNIYCFSRDLCILLYCFVIYIYYLIISSQCFSFFWFCFVFVVLSICPLTLL